MARELLKIKKISCVSGLFKNKKISCGPSGPDRPGRRPYPGGLKPKTRKPIGNLGHATKFVTVGNLGNDLDFVTIGKLGHALDFVTIGKLGNDLLFVNIGNLGNCLAVAKIANDFGGLHAFGDDGGGQLKIIGNIGKIVMPFKLA